MWPGTVHDALDGDLAIGLACVTPAKVVPPGGRGAGISAHWFIPQVLSQYRQRHTGRLEDGTYAAHTEQGYGMPRSRLVYNAAVGFEMRRRLRKAARG